MFFNPGKDIPQPYTLDLLLEYARFHQKPGTLASPPKQNISGPTSGSNPRSTTASRPSSQTTTISSTASVTSTSDGRFNCGPCKKSFGSEATWNSHQKSAKHIATLKDIEKKSKGSSSSTKGGSRSSTSNPPKGKQQQQQQQQRQDQQQQEQVPPEVAEALTSFRKVEKIVDEHPSMAAPVLWKIAKVLWSHRFTHDTAKVLSLLVKTLQGMQASSSTTSSIQPAAPGALSPTQISMTLYLARLALARLVIYTSPSLACQHYLDAIQGRWQIDAADFQLICE
ncbi:hypothetical protein BGZ94_009284, partial [Podila epigama]